jgi:hypothetical protein
MISGKGFEMRNKMPLMIVAGALVVATPAFAQNEVGPTNTTDMNSANTVSTEGVTDPNAVGGATSPTGAAAVPGDQSAVLPANSDTAAVDTGYGEPAQPQERRGFPWGVLGLLGLLGFLGRKRDRTDNSRR